MELLSVLVLDMIEILPLLGKYKYDTWRILLVKCYIDNSMRLWSYIQNINTLIYDNGQLVTSNFDITRVIENAKDLITKEMVGKFKPQC
jgi:hypothetical protein